MRNGTKNLVNLKEGALLAAWHVAERGYRIADDMEYVSGPPPGPDLPFLQVEKMPGSETEPPFLVPYHGKEKSYHPLGNKLLHRNFAKLDGSGDSILKFANRYGLLGKPSVLLKPPEGSLFSTVKGEALSVWRDKIDKFGRLLAIWDMIKGHEKRSGRLGQYIIRHPDSISFSACWAREGNDWKVYPESKYRKNAGMGYERQILASKKINPELLQRWHTGDVVEPAIYYVSSEVNENLHHDFSFRIFPFYRNKMFTVPDTLEAAMWLMFAYEIDGRDNPVQCMLCREWFQQDDKRRDYCSNACRQRAYRERITHAKG